MNTPTHQQLAEQIDALRRKVDHLERLSAFNDALLEQERRDTDRAWRATGVEPSVDLLRRARQQLETT